MSIDQDIATFKQELAPQFTKFSHQMMEKVQGTEDDCWRSAKGNEQKFIDCMSNKTKILSKTEKNLGFRMAYLDVYLEQCFKQAKEEKKPYDTCKQTARDKFQKFTDDITKSLSN